MMGLFARGKIKAEIIEKSIEPLQKEKEGLEAQSQDLAGLNEILEIQVDDYSNDAIRHQLERLDEIANDNNINELRSMVRDFIYKIEIFPKKDPKAKKWKRRISIQGYIRALTMILVASPKVIPLYPCCYLRIKRYCYYYEFYPTKRHKKPTVITKSSSST